MAAKPKRAPSSKGGPTAGTQGGARKGNAKAKRGKGRKASSGASAPAPEPWEAQEGEGARAFAAFATYRDLGPEERSLRRVGRELGKSGAQISKWSSAWRWVERAAAWDMEQDRVRRRELEQAQIEATRRHAQILARHLEATDKITAAFLAKVADEDGEEWLKNLGADELATLAIQAARVAPRLTPAERLVLGLSTTNVGGHAGGPVEIDPDAKARAKTDEELRRSLLGESTE